MGEFGERVTVPRVQLSGNLLWIASRSFVAQDVSSVRVKKEKIEPTAARVVLKGVVWVSVIGGIVLFLSAMLDSHGDLSATFFVLLLLVVGVVATCAYVFREMSSAYVLEVLVSGAPIDVCWSRSAFGMREAAEKVRTVSDGARVQSITQRVERLYHNSVHVEPHDGAIMENVVVGTGNVSAVQSGGSRIQAIEELKRVAGILGEPNDSPDGESAAALERRVETYRAPLAGIAKILGSDAREVFVEFLGNVLGTMACRVIGI